MRVIVYTHRLSELVIKNRRKMNVSSIVSFLFRTKRILCLAWASLSRLTSGLIMFPIPISLTGDSTGRTNGFVIVQYALSIVISSDVRRSSYRVFLNFAIELKNRLEKKIPFGGCRTDVWDYLGILILLKRFILYF